MALLKHGRSLVVAMLLLVGACLAGSARAASTDLYWVGPANGNFSTAANWALTSGGAGGTQAPVPGYTANFDGNGLNSCNIDAAVSCDGIIFNSSMKRKSKKKISPFAGPVFVFPGSTRR